MLLAARGCDLAQGYHYARPMPESDVPALPTHFR
jgi:EAL domain-containing protein (putative c-di-GMP-specific phosphodiesterase class I)